MLLASLIFFGLSLWTLHDHYDETPIDDQRTPLSVSIFFLAVAVVLATWYGRSF